MIATVLPHRVFYAHSMNAIHLEFSKIITLYIVSLFNSFIFDYILRQRVTANLTMFYIYQLPVPRLSENSTGQEKKTFDSLVERAAKLICTTEEFADLWKEVMGTKWTENSGVTDDKARAKLRAEIDAIVAHLYGIE